MTVVRRVSFSLLIAVIVPATLFYGFFALAGVWTAIVAALVWSYGAIAWRAVTGRRTSGLLILSALLLTGRTIALVRGGQHLAVLPPAGDQRRHRRPAVPALARQRPPDGGAAGR